MMACRRIASGYLQNSCYLLYPPAMLLLPCPLLKLSETRPTRTNAWVSKRGINLQEVVGAHLWPRPPWLSSHYAQISTMPFVNAHAKHGRDMFVFRVGEKFFNVVYCTTPVLWLSREIGMMYVCGNETPACCVYAPLFTPYSVVAAQCIVRMYLYYGDLTVTPSNSLYVSDLFGSLLPTRRSLGFSSSCFWGFKYVSWLSIHCS